MPLGTDFPIEEFWLRPALLLAAPARRNGAVFGVALRTSSDTTLVISLSPGGRAVLTAVADPPLERSLVSWRRFRTRDDPEFPLPHLGFAPAWQQRTWATPAAGALDSQVAEFPAADLISNGVFIFDRADGACEDADNSGAWLTWRRNGDASILARNSLVFSKLTERSRLVLVDEWRETLPLREVRSTDAGRTLLAFHGSSAAPQFAQGQWRAGRPVWEATQEAVIAREFQVGEMVSLNLSDLSWETAPEYPWTPGAGTAEHCVPRYPGLSGYPFLSSVPTLGLRFAFDDWLSVSTRDDKGSREIAVATGAGVWIGPLLPEAYSTFGHRSGRFYCAERTTGAEPAMRPLEGLRRVRFEAGEGWVATTLTGRRLVLTMPSDPAHSGWKEKPGLKSRSEVTITEGGVNVNGTFFAKSTDAWIPNRRSLNGTIDIIRGSRPDEYWIATEEAGGLFKITIP